MANQKTKAQLALDLNVHSENMTATISPSNYIEPLEDQAVRTQLNLIIDDLIISNFNVVDGIQIANITGLTSALSSKHPFDPTILNQSTLVDNLVTLDATRPLTANQGVVLKNLIDAIPSRNDATSLAESTPSEVTAIELRSHLDDTSMHFTIADGTVNTTSVWSSTKILSELILKADASHTHSQLHTQGTDVTLALATPSEVTAVDLREHLDSAVNPHTTTLTQVVEASSLPTTKGILYTSNGTSLIGFPVGIDGQVLKVNSLTASGLEFSSDIGEVNTIASLGTGESIAIGKVGTELRTRALNSLNSILTITTNGNQLDFDIEPEQINHADLANIGANTHAQIDAHIAAINPHGLTLDLLSPLTAAGDLLTYNGSNNVRFGIGTNGQVLASNGTSLVWSSDLSVASSHTVSTSNPHITNVNQVAIASYGSVPSKGTLLVSDGTNVLELAPGVDGQMLIANSSNTLGVQYTAAGEINTATSLSGTGQEITAGKTGAILNFRRIETGDASKLTVTTAGNQIILSVVDGGIDHDSLAGLGGTPIYTHANIDSHINAVTGNPHNVTASDIGVDAGATNNPQQLAIVTLTDSTTGTVDNTLSSISGSGADVDINNNFAELANQIALIKTALTNSGITA